MKPQQLIEHELPANSGATLCELSENLSPDDSLGIFQRACHMLLLAQQWDGLDEAKVTSAMVHEFVRKGETDSAARVVHRFNAS